VSFTVLFFNIYLVIDVVVSMDMLITVLYLYGTLFYTLFSLDLFFVDIVGNSKRCIYRETLKIFFKSNLF